MQSFSHSLSIENSVFYENCYESGGTPRVCANPLEERLNKFLDQENAFICDPLDKINEFYKKKQYFIWKKQESRGSNEISCASLKEIAYENLSTNQTISETELKSQESLVFKEKSQGEEMFLKGVESFKLIRRRKQEGVEKKPLEELKEEEKS